MVETAPPTNTEGGEQLFDKGGGWNRDSDGPRGILDEVEIFKMKIDFETGSKIARQYFVGLLLEAFAACKASRESLNHLLRIYTRLSAKDQCLSNSGKVNGHDNLVCQLGEAASTERSHVGDCFS